MRVLVLDGGGARGLFTLEVLRYIEISCGRPIRECFDLVVGTSIGAFIAGSIVAGKSIDEMEQCCIPLLSSLGNANLSLSSAVSRLWWGHVLKGEDLENPLHEVFGDTPLIDLPESPRLLMMAADARSAVPHPYLMRNRPLPEDVANRSPFASSTTLRLVDAIRAATAAPTIYPAHVVDGIPLVDAAIITNNPVLFALAETTLLSSSLDCIVSIGSGTHPRIPHPTVHRGILTWTMAAIERCSDSDTPDMLIRGMLPPSKYIRFDPPNAGTCGVWESNVSTLRKWQTLVQEYMHDQQETLVRLIPLLSRQ
jgi:predicted acylesterase/phospholipase RssA